MIRYAIVGIASGILFAILDALISGNPLAQRLHDVYKPMAKTSVNLLAGLVIDLAYGLVMAGAFLLLYQSLPGRAPLLRGISFALLVWFFRVVMSTLAQWMICDVPAGALLYTLFAGLVQMLLLGMLYGLALGRTL